VLQVLLGSSFNERFSFNTQDQVYVTAQKGATVGNTTVNKVGYIGYIGPDQGSRLIQNVAFDYTWSGQTNWQVGLQSFTSSWGGLATLWFANGAGATQRGSVCATLGTPRDRVAAYLFYNAADAVVLGETGDAYLSLTNVRVTTQALAVDTTLSAGALLGATAILVTSATNITVGMSLYLGGTNPERVTVSSVAGLTIGITPLAAAKAGGDTVRAQRVLVSDIAADVAATVAALNPGQLESGTQLIQPSIVDRRDVLVQDQPATAILEGLASEEQLACGVTRDRLLWLRPRDQAAWSQAYAVDAADLTLGRTIEQLRNQVYATYEDPDGRPLRTAAATSAQSVARWGLTRQAALAVQTTALEQATALRDYALADADDPPSQAAITFTRLFLPNGAGAPLTALEAGDTLTIRNLLINAGGDIDDLTTVRVARVVYDPVADDRAARLTVELENPPAELEVALARIALFYEPPAPQGLDKPLRIAR